MTATKLAMLLGLTAFWSLLFMLCAQAVSTASQQRDVVNVCTNIRMVAMVVLFASIVGLAAVATYAAIAP